MRFFFFYTPANLITQLRHWTSFVLLHKCWCRSSLSNTVSESYSIGCLRKISAI